jgi:pimeloyl-ACP methyl ester carboxylesterase
MERRLLKRRTVLGAGLSMIASATSSRIASAANGPKTIVLIHGAWYDSGSWRKIVPALTARGHTVIAPDMPGFGKKGPPRANIELSEYVDAVIDAVNSVSGPVMLVGHSLGGVFVSQAAERIPDKITSLTYVCAFMLQNGQSRLSVASQDPESAAIKYRIPAGEGLVSFTREGFIKSLYNDCSPEDVEYLLARTAATPVKPLGIPLQLTAANYGRIRRYYVKCLLDQAITPAFQQKMIDASPVARTFELEASHSPFMSKPDELISVLLEVASV